MNLEKALRAIILNENVKEEHVQIISELFADAANAGVKFKNPGKLHNSLVGLSLGAAADVLFAVQRAIRARALINESVEAVLSENEVSPNTVKDVSLIFARAAEAAAHMDDPTYLYEDLIRLSPAAKARILVAIFHNMYDPSNDELLEEGKKVACEIENFCGMSEKIAINNFAKFLTSLRGHKE